jgi:hypothetical protein
MKSTVIVALLLAITGSVSAQTQTTRDLEEKYNGFTLFFYKNTLRMVNQKEDEAFDELIRNIEKMKFLMVSKTGEAVKPIDYRGLVAAYKKEKFEPIVTSRIEGRNLDVYLRDSGGKPGTVVLVNDSTSLYVLDIVGTIDVSKAGALFNAIDSSSDIGKRIREFTEDKGDSKGRRRRGPN